MLYLQQLKIRKPWEVRRDCSIKDVLWQITARKQNLANE
jgi:hypothetical protein